MSSVITNPSPHWNPLGTEDISTRQFPREQLAYPQHLPKVWFWAQKGTTEPTLVVGSERDLIYGSETWREGSKYFNHATMLANTVNKNGNVIMAQRLLPQDVGPKSNLIVWLDVLPTTVDLYERNSDRSIKVNQLGEPTVIGTTQGHKVKFVATYRDSHESQASFGGATQVAGDQIDPVTNTQSIRVPIFEIENHSEGADGNNTAIRLWAPTRASMPVMPARLMAEQKAYPYMISIMSRENELASAKPTRTVFGTTETMMSFKKDSYDPSLGTGSILDVQQILVGLYNSVGDPNFPDIYGRVGRFHLYNEQLEELLTAFHAAEAPFIDSLSDFGADEEDKHLFNFVTGVDSENAPYHSYVYVESPTTVRFSNYNNVYLQGGSDGTMTSESFDDLVASELRRYADPEDPVQELAYNVESVVYDSGFSLETKLEIPNFIARRYDTVAILGTHTVGERTLDNVDENSIAITLRTRLNNFPESAVFGTSVFRAMIMGNSGTVRNSGYRERVPMTIELADKFSKYMGASNGQWKSDANPEGEPGNTVTILENVNAKYISPSVRARFWSVGLNWVQRGDRSELFIPTYKTVCEDETSVLNSILTAFAIATINKYTYRVWKRYVGRSDLSGPQLTRNTNEDITSMVAGKFAGRYQIVPQATITSYDELRGTSWTAPVLIGANNMRHTMTTYVRAARLSDIQAIVDSGEI